MAICWWRDHKYVVKFKCNFECLAWACSCFNCPNSCQKGFLDLANELRWTFNRSRLSTSRGSQPNLHMQIGARMWASAWANLFFLLLFLETCFNFVPKSEFPWFGNCSYLKLSLPFYLASFPGEFVLTTEMSGKHRKRRLLSGTFRKMPIETAMGHCETASAVAGVKRPSDRGHEGVGTLGLHYLVLHSHGRNNWEKKNILASSSEAFSPWLCCFTAWRWGALF